MTNQEIYNTLSELEFQIWARLTDRKDKEGVSDHDLFDMQNTLRQALSDWHRVTGCRHTE